MILCKFCRFATLLVMLCVSILVSAQEFDEKRIRRILENFQSSYNVISDCELCDQVIAKLAIRNHSSKGNSNSALTDVEHNFKQFFPTLCQLLNSTSSKTRSSSIATKLWKNLKEAETIQRRLEAQMNGFTITAPSNGLLNVSDEMCAVFSHAIARTVFSLERSVVEEFSWHENRNRDYYCRVFNLTDTGNHVTRLLVQRLIPVVALLRRISGNVERHIELWGQGIAQKEHNHQTLSGQLDRIETDLMQALRSMEHEISAFRSDISSQWKQWLTVEPDFAHTLLKRVLKLAIYDVPAIFLQLTQSVHNRVQLVQTSRKTS